MIIIAFLFHVEIVYYIIKDLMHLFTQNIELVGFVRCVVILRSYYES